MANRFSIDEAIYESNKRICYQIRRLEKSAKGETFQAFIESLRYFVEHILLKVYANGDNIEDSYKNIQAAVMFAKNETKLLHILRFYRFLLSFASNEVLKEQNAERWMLNCYENLLRIRIFLRENYSMDVLENLERFPLDVNGELTEYYTEIAKKVDAYHAPIHDKSSYDRYYVQKVKPFFINGKVYYEISFTPANDYASKTDSAIAYTNMEITSFYAVKFAIADDHIEIFGNRMPIRIIVNWEVNIRPCELKNFHNLIDNSSPDYQNTSEQQNLSRFLTQTGFSLSEIVLFSDDAFEKIKHQLVPRTKAKHFFDCLEKCRNIIKHDYPGSNVLRYLLHHMTNKVIKKQYAVYENYTLSDLYLAYECIPFDQMPFCSGLKNHVPNLSDLFDCLDASGREHEILARIVQNNTKNQNILFTPLEKGEDGKYRLDPFNDVESLVSTYNQKLYGSKRQQLRKMIIKHDHLFIEGDKEDTVFIIKAIQKLAQNGVKNYTRLADSWMRTTHQVNSDEKKIALRKMFSKSKVALIYGSAGTGKTYLVNHISNLFADKSKLYLAQTNPAVNNLRRKITASANHSFMTISSFISNKYTRQTSFDILIIDECSTVNNQYMRRVLEKADFEMLVLVGDTYQIESIEFGNWFDAVRYFVPQTSVFELTESYRSESESLLRIWHAVRKMEGDVYNLLQTFGCSANLDKSIFSPAEENEIMLCLNYGGLYGINNINHFLQECNNGKEIWRDVQRYKVGDPILFNDAADNFFERTAEQVPIIHNNMAGRIVDFERINADTAAEGIQFDIEIDCSLTDDINTQNLGFILVRNAANGNSVIRFIVNKNKSTDEDDDRYSKSIVPFQIAYAVSIHKAQGLEYDSVKIIITDEIDELITHNIFYTAITRARKSLKIYWTQPVEEKVLKQIQPHDNRNDVSLLMQEMEESGVTE